jgi:AcrR family transcriptional regulator
MSKTIALPEKARRGRPPKAISNARNIRDELIQAAALEFQEVGYHDTNSNRIAARAGFAPGTFYNHFADKVDVFATLYQRWFQEFTRGVRVRLFAKSSDPAKIARSVTKFMMSHRADWYRIWNSAEMLAATEPRVRFVCRRAQEEAAHELLKLLPRTSPPQVAMILHQASSLSSFFVSGDAEAAGLSEQAIRSRIEGLFIELLGSKVSLLQRNK